MKRILMIFLILAGGYLLFTAFGSLPSLFGKDNTTAIVSNKIDHIEFEISSANLNIIPDNRKELEAVLEGSGKLTVEESGDTITVTHERKWFEWLPFFNTSKVTVYIPEDFDRDMRIDSNSGQINFSGESANKPFKLEQLTLDINSGNVNLNNLAVNEFVHDGSSGNLSINNIATKTSSIDISSGNAKVAEFTGKFEADISSGKLDIKIQELTDSVNIDLSSGDVQLDLPDNADFILDGDIGSGHISNNFPLTIEEQDNNNIKGKHGSGKHKIEIDVSSGNVNIY